MNNPFSPPTAQVADIERSTREASWARTILLIVVFGALSLATSWLVVPLVAGSLARMFGIASANATPDFLAIDLALSFLVFCVGCFLAAKLSLGHTFAAALGVGLLGWLVYFVEVGGVRGMLNSEFPLWYEFFPSHTFAVAAAWFLARRQR